MIMLYASILRQVLSISREPAVTDPRGEKKRLQREGLQALYALAENWEEECFQPLDAGNLGGGRPCEFLLDR